MTKLAILVIAGGITLGLMTLNKQTVYVQEKTKIESGGLTVAPLPTEVPTPTPDPRIETIREYLERHNSELSDYAGVIVERSFINSVDPYVVVAISGQESSFGKHACGHNAWGLGSCSDKYRFSSWESGIDYITWLLDQSFYKGKTIEQIGHTYCPPSNCDTERWVRGVRYFYEQLSEGGVK